MDWMKWNGTPPCPTRVDPGRVADQSSLWRGKSNHQSITAINNHIQAMTQPAVFFYPLLRPPLSPHPIPSYVLPCTPSDHILFCPILSNHTLFQSHPILSYSMPPCIRYDVGFYRTHPSPPPAISPFPSDHSQSIPSNSRHSAM